MRETLERGGLTGNLVSESLRLDDRDVIDDSLVGVEISSEFSVVSLDDGLGCSLNSLGSNSSLYTRENRVVRYPSTQLY